MMDVFDFHADDYGISKNSCDDIISLLEKGCLNSVSILPNMNSFNYAVERLSDFIFMNPEKEPLISIHLNFLEGHCCAPIQQVSSLVDSRGYFKINWRNLFLWNYNPFLRNKIIRELEAEIMAQTKKCLNAKILKPKGLRFDGHQHTHMIPLVFEALQHVCKNLEEEGFRITFIRNAQELFFPYLKIFKIWKTYRIVNIIKCLILNFYSIRIRTFQKKHDLSTPYLCGVFFSGYMDNQRLEKILPFYYKKTDNKNRTIELLFHPGTVLENEITEEFVKPDFNAFHTSTNRKIEYNSIIKLRSYMFQKI